MLRYVKYMSSILFFFHKKLETSRNTSSFPAFAPHLMESVGLIATQCLIAKHTRFLLRQLPFFGRTSDPARAGRANKNENETPHPFYWMVVVKHANQLIIN